MACGQCGLRGHNPEQAPDNSVIRDQRDAAALALLVCALVVLASEKITHFRFGHPNLWETELTGDKLTSRHGNEMVVVSTDVDGPTVLYTIDGQDYILGEPGFPYDKFKAWRNDLSMFIEGL